ncbi:MAG: nitrogenase stabilizing/protective protein NifW [Pseudomonadota bacterium]
MTCLLIHPAALDIAAPSEPTTQTHDQQGDHAMKDLSGKTLLEQIESLSSAEDFFLFFLMPFDQQVLNVNRLHIMKRMGQYLAKADFEGMSDDDVFLEARLVLKRAYMDFVESTPLQEKVFKVFTDKQREMDAKFVDIGSLSLAAE